MTEIFLPAFVTLFVIVDPLGLMPIFAVTTEGGGRLHRRRMALRGTGIATGILLLFALLGESILDVFGITLAAFRIAGGVLLFATALEMIFEFRAKRRSHTAESAVHAPPPDDISVYPLAIPLLAGPGAITSIILLTSPHAGDWLATGLVIAALLLVMVISLLLFALSGPLMKLLGATVAQIITRLLGVILAALAVQFIIDGIAATIAA